MRVRADSVLLSCVLDTIALLCLIRPALWNYFAGSDKALLAQMDLGFREEAQTSHYLGVACLAIILIGLIVVWTGYIKRSRSAWLVMFVIVWLWAFPLFMLDLFRAFLKGHVALTFFETLYHAISGPGIPRTVVELALIFSSMVIALVLPMKKFFFADGGEEPIHRPSARLVSFSVIGVLVILTALYAWIRVGVIYQIPVTELSSTQRLPSPPPPPHAGD